jgi:hypothetical protein
MYKISNNISASNPPTQEEGGDDPASSLAGLLTSQVNIEFFKKA